MRIRDQTHSVSSKLIQQKAKTNLSFVINFSLYDRAKAAFFSNYVFHGSRSYDFLQPFYSSADVDKPLSASLEAVSLAYFAHQENADLAVKEGRSRYTSALTLVKQAVSCPVAARKDSTLLATMALDLYEKITNFNPEFDQSWKSHVRGSLALLGLRGPHLFHDRNGFRMLVRLSTNLLISCVATDTPAAGLAALREYESNYLEKKDPKWLLSDLMMYYVSLRDDISKGRLTDHDTIASLRSLDADFANLAINAPKAWQCHTVRLHSPTERVLGDHMTIFLDHHITQTWNVLKSIRILLNELLSEYSTSSPAGWAYKAGFSLRTHAEDIISELVNEICASIPQYTCPELVQHQSVSPSWPESKSSERHNDEAIAGIHIYTPAEKVRAYTLIFPLYVAGQSIAAAEHQKLWIIGQLHFMASAMGIRNAEVVAKILEAGVKMSPWKVYALLGSYAFAA